MPIFEFVCEECDNFFEELVSSANTVSDVNCPECRSNQVNKQFSTFASKVSRNGSFTTSSAPAPAASCNTGGL